MNAIELSLEETHIAKTGLIEGSKKALADQLRVDKESISDKIALQGILFLNEDYTIERIKYLLIYTFNGINNNRYK